EELAGCVQPRAEAEEALLHAWLRPAAVPGARGLLECRVEPEPALLAGALIGMSLDEGEALVTQADEITGHLEGRGVVVDAHAHGVCRRTARRDRHDGQANRTELRAHHGRFAERRR